MIISPRSSHRFAPRDRDRADCVLELWGADLCRLTASECNHGQLNGTDAVEVHLDRQRWLDEPYPGGESLTQLSSGSPAASLICSHPVTVIEC